MQERTMNENDPTAQGPDDADQSDEQSNEVGQSQFSGFQKRIDEMTAKMGEMERTFVSTITQKDQQINQLLVELTKRPGEGNEEEDEEIDPNVDKALQKRINRAVQPFQQTLNRYEQTIDQLRYQNQINGADPEVVKKAEELMGQWKKEGKTGWAMSDALIFAERILGKPLKPKASPSNRDEETGQFTTAPQTHVAPTNKNRKQNKRPANFDQLSPEKQVAILEAEGVGDLPL